MRKIAQCLCGTPHTGFLKQFASHLRDPAALHRECARLRGGLHNMNLQRVDRMTMAHSIEGRVPFLDIDFLDAVMAVQPSGKLHGPDCPEKWLLRDAVKGLLPEAILWLTKQELAQGCGSEWTLWKSVS